MELHDSNAYFFNLAFLCSSKQILVACQEEKWGNQLIKSSAGQVVVQMTK